MRDMTSSPLADILHLEQEMVKAGLAAETASLALLRAEMQALAAMIPGHGERPRSDGEVEAEFDNMPV
jgi:hypothetical protein